jgi:two-component system chemotaxis response regulator CheB
MGKSILIVDDSALIRKQLGDTLDKAGYDIGFANNGQEAVEFVREFEFDAITMDINMPVMDGLTAVKQIMAIKPTPILMVSSLTTEDADITFEALDAGALDFILKPGTITLKLEESEQEILEKVKAVSNIPKNRLLIKKQATTRRLDLSKKNSNVTLSSSVNSNEAPQGVVLIGASTGGPGLIEEITKTLPANYPYPVVVIQHMPENFTNGFAVRLNNSSYLDVVESKPAMPVVRGQVIIAKGGFHLRFSKKASGAVIVKQIEKNKRFFTPSADELFLSGSKVFEGSTVLAVELTGIGNDGAEGMLKLRQEGAYTIAEDETTAIVYGMPKSCWENGGAMKKMPFPKILDEILNFPNYLENK